MKKSNRFLQVIIVVVHLFFISLHAHSEQWDLILDNGQGSGNATFNKHQNDVTTADGNWIYNHKGTMTYGSYVAAPVTIEGTSISIKASGTAISPSSPPGYNTSPFVLTIDGNALNGLGDGTYQIVYSNPFWWPNMISGTWIGTRTIGSGITAETKAMLLPWLFLLLDN